MIRSALTALLIALLAAPVVAAGVVDAGSAAERARSMTGGRVLDVQTRSEGKRHVYDVKVLLDDGRVKVIRIEGDGREGERAAPR